MQKSDLTIIGGGIMGLLAAYYAIPYSQRIILMDKSTIGNQLAASSGLTRSIRNDYLDPFYSKIAYESQQLWRQIETNAQQNFFVKCGVLNVANRKLTPDLKNTYASQSFSVLKSLNRKIKLFNESQLSKIFPQFTIDLACLDEEAGLLLPQPIISYLTSYLKTRSVRIIENVQIKTITYQNLNVKVSTNLGNFSTKKLLITAGTGTNDALNKIQPNTLPSLPIRIQSPAQSYYFKPEPTKLSAFTSTSFPVFAYLDLGIYGHPIYSNDTPGVKIGWYNPNPNSPELDSSLSTINKFLKTCIPALASAKVDTTYREYCQYDITPDNEFIVGSIQPNIFVATGFNGTGFKFAPYIGKMLSKLLIADTLPPILNRWSPARLSKYLIN